MFQSIEEGLEVYRHILFLFHMEDAGISNALAVEFMSPCNAERRRSEAQVTQAELHGMEKALGLTDVEIQKECERISGAFVRL